jgi:hypothetical protein
MAGQRWWHQRVLSSPWSHTLRSSNWPSPRYRLLTGLGAVIAVQCSYLALCFALEQFDAENAVPAIHTAIGEQLRSEIEIPRDLPPQLALLVVQLQAA